MPRPFIHSLSAALLLLGAASCGLPLAEPEGLLTNSCQSDEACGASGRCIEGICVSTVADLQGVIVQIDAPSAASYGAGTSSLVPVAAHLQGSDANGFSARHDLITHPIVPKTFRYAPELEPFPDACRVLLESTGTWDSDRTFPITVELHPIDTTGLPLPVYTAQSELAEDTNAVTLNVPDAAYRVYLRPMLAPPGMPEGSDYSECQMPPALFVSRPGSDVPLPLEVPQTVSGTIAAGALPLEGWTLDIVDKVSGRLISTQLSLPAAVAGLVDFTEASAPLHFWKGLGDPDVVPYVRLAPPEGSAGAEGMPIIYWDLNTQAGLSGYDQLNLDVSLLAEAQVVSVEGRVFDSIANDDVPATVIIHSAVLHLGNANEPAVLGSNVSYKTKRTTDGNGGFEVELFPGDYRVVVIPASPDLAITAEDWTIGPSNTGVRTFEVNTKSTLQAHQVVTAQGIAAHGIPIFAQPSSKPPQYFALMDALAPNAGIQPTSATTVTQADGSFSLALDPGEFDIFVRPPQQTAMPWAANPRVRVTPTEEPPNLGDVRIGHPVVLYGQVVTPEEQPSPIAGAIIRAWLPLADAYTSDGEGPTFSTAIQIGETTADSQGRYRLLLPPSISQ